MKPTAPPRRLRTCPLADFSAILIAATVHICSLIIGGAGDTVCRATVLRHFVRLAGSKAHASWSFPCHRAPR